MKLNKPKKIISVILMLIMLLSALPVQVFADTDINLGEVDNNANINIYTQNDYGHQLHTTRVNGTTYPLFCVEYGKSSPSSSTLSKQGVPSDNDLIIAARWIFAGYYMEHGNSINWLDMAYCQKKVWQVMGWNSTWNFSDSGYDAWVENAKRNMDAIETYPSFDAKTNYKVVAGKSLTISDSNKVFEDYPAFDYTENGIRYKHTSGSNDLIITVSKDCKATTFNILDRKYYKTVTGQDQNCLLYSPSSGGDQKLLYSAYYDPISFSVKGTVVPLGNITVTKKDIYDASVNGAEFGLYSDKACTKLISTTKSTNGSVKFTYLEPGTYYVKETKAPTGYLLNNTVLTLNVTSNGNVTSVIKNSEPTGTIKLTKNLDTSKTNSYYGDVNIGEAQYTLYAAEKITSKAGTKVFYNKDDVVGTKTVSADNDTSASITWDKLPLGSYYIKETQAPEGTFLDEQKYEVTLSYKDQNTSIITNNSTISTDLVKSQKVKIFKAGNDGSAGEMQGVDGAQFTIKLYDDYSKALEQGYKVEEIFATLKDDSWIGVDVYGKSVTVDSTKAQEAQKIAPSYAVLTTDEYGYAVSSYLPYGKYVCKETYTPVDYISGSDVIFSITKDESEYPIEYAVKTLNINNGIFKSPVKIVKKDADTGKNVSLTSATYKIRAARDIKDRSTGKIIYHEGDYIKVKVGNNKYDEFTTNSDGLISIPEGGNYASKNDEKGTVTTPFKLDAGYYELVEIKAPEGFLINSNPVPFVVTNATDIESDRDEDGDIICVVEQTNKQPKANIEINKVFELRDNMDKSFIEVDENGNVKNIENVTFELIANETITDKTDGSVIYNKGDIIDTKTLTVDGKLEFSNLWIGSYIVKETKTIDGFVLDSTEYPVVFEAKDDTTETYTQTVDFTNNTTEVDISKTDVTTGKELEGAKLTLTDKDGNIIDEWISTKEAHRIEGLKVGESYTLTEITAPYGYDITESITFTIDNTKEVQKVVMSDDYIYHSIKVVKCDKDTGKRITSNDFEFGIYSDKECKNLITKVSADENGNVQFDKLIYGTYYLKETKAPQGYLLSDKVVEIVINENGVFADGEQLDGQDNIYSLSFYDEAVPVPETGDKDIKGVAAMGMSLSLLIAAFVILIKRMRKI